MHESPLLWEDPERAVEAMFLSVRLTLSLSLCFYDSCCLVAILRSLS